jgi:hypothetical protein
MAAIAATEIAAHIERTNPHGGARSAWLGMPIDWRELRWRRETLKLSDLPTVHPASVRDVKRYATHAKTTREPFPAIVVVVRGGRISVADGAHRLAAARQLGHETIDAFVGS